MRLAEPYAYQEGFPGSETWNVPTNGRIPGNGKWEGVHPSFLTIGGSGIVGNFGSQSPMSRKHRPTYPKNVRAAGPTSGSGSAAGAAITAAGSGLA
jgi:hypothetical protein